MGSVEERKYYMNCKECGEPLTTEVCPRCKSLAWEWEKQAQKVIKFLDVLIICFGVLFLLISAGMFASAVMNGTLGVESYLGIGYPAAIFAFVLGAILILWAVLRKKNRKKYQKSESDKIC